MASPPPPADPHAEAPRSRTKSPAGAPMRCGDQASDEPGERRGPGRAPAGRSREQAALIGSPNQVEAVRAGVEGGWGGSRMGVKTPGSHRQSSSTKHTGAAIGRLVRAVHPLRPGVRVRNPHAHHLTVGLLARGADPGQRICHAGRQGKGAAGVEKRAEERGYRFLPGPGPRRANLTKNRQSAPASLPSRPVTDSEAVKAGLSPPRRIQCSRGCAPHICGISPPRLSPSKSSSAQGTARPSASCRSPAQVGNSATLPAPRRAGPGRP